MVEFQHMEVLLEFANLGAVGVHSFFSAVPILVDLIDHHGGDIVDL